MICKFKEEKRGAKGTVLLSTQFKDSKPARIFWVDALASPKFLQVLVLS